jgi:hypothetical protein
MFPHMPGGPAHDNEKLAWLVFWTLNIGLLLRAIGEPLAALGRAPIIGVLLPLSATLQLAAVLVFVLLVWPRIRPAGVRR